MKAVISLCCADIIRDAETNSVSLYNIYEEIIGESFPLVLQKFSVYYFLEREDGDVEGRYSGRITVYSNEKEKGNYSVRYTISSKKRTRLIVRFTGMAVDEPGELKLTLFDSFQKSIGDIIIPAILIPRTIIDDKPEEKPEEKEEESPKKEAPFTPGS